MKRILAILLAGIMAMTLVSCDLEEKQQNKNNDVQNEEIHNEEVNDDKSAEMQSENNQSEVDNQKNEETYEWPDNEFTKLVPTPEIEAKVLSADTIGKMFSIQVDWTLDEGAVYAQQLADAGFGEDCAEKFAKYGYIDRTENGVNVQLLEIGGKVDICIMPVE